MDFWSAKIKKIELEIDDFLKQSRQQSIFSIFNKKENIFRPDVDDWNEITSSLIPLYAQGIIISLQTQPILFTLVLLL